MTDLKVPDYVSIAFEDDCKRLKLPREYFVEVFSYPPAHECGDRGGFCKPIFNRRNVVMGIRDEGKKGKTLGNLRHNMKHAQQFFTGNYSESSSMADELDAYAYEWIRGVEDKLKWFYRKLGLR